jgi:hypothetical protein
MNSIASSDTGMFKPASSNEPKMIRWAYCIFDSMKRVSVSMSGVFIVGVRV